MAQPLHLGKTALDYNRIGKRTVYGYKRNKKYKWNFQREHKMIYDVKYLQPL